MASARKQAAWLGLRHLTLMVIAFLMLVHAPRVYLVQSEPEMGRGYVDILLLQRPGVPEVWEHAIELKYLKSEAGDDTIAQAADQARAQLSHYLESEGLRDRPRLISWVVVFRGAKCEVLERQPPHARG